jgi:hypothetical protein
MKSPFARGIAGLVTGLSLLLPLAFLSAHAEDAQWTLPRTSWGDPDLEGHWTNRTLITLERPDALADKAYFTPEEFKAYAAAQEGADETTFGASYTAHYNLDDYGLGDAQNQQVEYLRTSIITKPENGRLPPLTPEAKARREAYLAFHKEHQFDSAKTRSLAERCIVWVNTGPPILPRGYNSHYQIIQAKGYVVIMMEMIHDARIIPLDGSPHASPNIRSWLGDSRGHWEGDTLVVETTNFDDRLHQHSEYNFSGITKALKVTERFTRTGPNHIDYRFTVSDPGTWTAPWSGTSPWESTDGPMFEYACHEGNYGMPNTLSGMRAEERKQNGGEK